MCQRGCALCAAAHPVQRVSAIAQRRFANSAGSVQRALIPPRLAGRLEEAWRGRKNTPTATAACASLQRCLLLLLLLLCLRRCRQRWRRWQQWRVCCVLVLHPLCCILLLLVLRLSCCILLLLVHCRCCCTLLLLVHRCCRGVVLCILQAQRKWARSSRVGKEGRSQLPAPAAPPATLLPAAARSNPAHDHCAGASPRRWHTLQHQPERRLRRNWKQTGHSHRTGRNLHVPPTGTRGRVLQQETLPPPPPRSLRQVHQRPGPRPSQHQHPWCLRSTRESRGTKTVSRKLQS